MEKPREADKVKGVDEVFADNEGKDAGRVIGDPANWPGSTEREMHAIAGENAEQDPDALLATELLEKADEEKRRGGEHQAN